jgi:hypothetical protein
MNTQKSIYNKLFKYEQTELATQEVNLALADDIKAAIDATLAFKDKKKAAWNKASTPLIAVYDMLRAEYAAANKALTGINDLKAKAKDLGTDVPAKILNSEKQIVELVKTSKSKFDQMNKIINSIPDLVL